MPLRVLIDPNTGKIMEEHFWGQTACTFIYQLHATLLTARFFDGDISRRMFKFVCGLGLPIALLILTGLFMAKRSFLKSMLTVFSLRRFSFSKVIYDMHKVFGVFSAVVLMIVALTGFSFAYNDYFVNFFGFFSKNITNQPASVMNLISSPSFGRNRISISEVMAVADRVFPNSELRWIETPENSRGVYVVGKKQLGELNNRRPNSKVFVDQYSGKILGFENPNKYSVSQSFLAVLRPLHSGDAFGDTGKVIWFLAGLSPMVLYITGIVRWRQKL